MGDVALSVFGFLKWDLAVTLAKVAVRLRDNTGKALGGVFDTPLAFSAGRQVLLPLYSVIIYCKTCYCVAG